AFENGKRDGVLDPQYIREIPDPDDPNYTLFGTHSQFEELGLAHSPRTLPLPAPTRAAALLQTPQTPTPFTQTPPPHPRRPIFPPSPPPPQRQLSPPPPPVPIRRTTRTNAGVPPGNWWEVRQQRTFSNSDISQWYNPTESTPSWKNQYRLPIPQLRQQREIWILRKF
ncbi:hypothetical protein EX30DRAFT_352869, partial [Ascodesmis nigricans]